MFEANFQQQQHIATHLEQNRLFQEQSVRDHQQLVGRRHRTGHGEAAPAVVAPTAATHGFADWDKTNKAIKAHNTALAKEMEAFDAEFAQRTAQMAERRKAFDKLYAERTASIAEGRAEVQARIAATKAAIQAARAAW